MKSYITKEMWSQLENIFAKYNIGYSVIFDDHNGVPEMLVTANTISIYRPEEMLEDEENIQECKDKITKQMGDFFYECCSM